MICCDDCIDKPYTCEACVDKSEKHTSEIYAFLDKRIQEAEQERDFWKREAERLVNRLQWIGVEIATETKAAAIANIQSILAGTLDSHRAAVAKRDTK